MRSPLPLLALCAVGAAACGGPADEANGTPTSDPATGGRPATTGGTGGVAMLLPDASPPESDAQVAPVECAGQHVQAQGTPVDLFILLDQSGSMTEFEDRWGPVTRAIDAFVSEPSLAGLGVGLQYFPLGATQTRDPVICEVARYATPSVPIGALPDQAEAIVASIEAHTFVAAQSHDPEHWGTPTKPAVQGAIEYLTGWATAHPDHVPVLLIATDGQPSQWCVDYSIEGICSVIAAAAAATPRIQTYVVGIGEIDRLGEMATAGGTGQPAFIVDASGQSTEADFIAVLERIRGLTLPCDYPIPTPETGSIDFGKVNVEFTDPQGARTGLANVPDASACGTGLAWSYDVPTAPTRVVLCPAACQAISGRLGRVDVVFGCDTVVLVR